MKYITTDKHPLGKGHIIQKSESNHLDYMFNVDKSSCTICTMYLTKGHLNHLLSNGYIKEVEEKEFTKSDMIYFASWTLGAYSDGCDPEHLENWLKEREK